MKTIFLFVFLFASAAFGRGNPPRALAANTLSDGTWSGTNNVYAKIIPYGGGVGFAGNYEKVLSNNFGVGGGITILPEKNDVTDTRPKLTSLGGNVYVHFPVDVMDFYVSPGLNIMIMELGTEDETTIGASMAFGTVAQVTKAFAIGLEFSAQHPWFNKESYLASRMYFFNSAITARFTF